MDVDPGTVNLKCLVVLFLLFDLFCLFVYSNPLLGSQRLKIKTVRSSKIFNFIGGGGVFGIVGDRLSIR